MQKVLSNIPDKRIRLYIVWLPVLRSDNRAAAEKRVNEFSDPRLTYFWDENRITGLRWQPILRIRDLAWDVYLVYGLDNSWNDNPSVPDFWMHQLGNVGYAPNLYEPEFESKINQLLSGHRLPKIERSLIPRTYSTPNCNHRGNCRHRL